ncbi:MAG: uracil-DNA glycosylase family protein [Candidatus Woesearchaeota archaeon]|nr:uracil-DNA glycosylase family protein [Candidatus Woesearchaeota archaeon]
MVQNCKTLNELWKMVDEINKQNFPDNNLKPILGNGQLSFPKIMFVFINPTHANISSDKNWQGPRFPFIGTKQVWRIFHRAGLFDDKLIEKINNSKSWSLEFTSTVLDFLKSKSFYFTNIVKWTGHDATLPNSKKIGLFLPILEKEIEIVQPEFIVTFGLIPFENITKQKIKLSDYYTTIMRDKIIRFVEMKFGEFQTKIIPCYFPIGRGSPKKAVEILKLVDSLVSLPHSQITT